MISVEIAFTFLCCVAFIAAFFGWKLYKTALNPLTLTSVNYMCIITIFSGIVAYSIVDVASYSEDAIVKTALISLVHFIAIILPYSFKHTLFFSAYGKTFDFLGFSKTSVEIKFSRLKFALLLCGMLASFVALAVVGGGGDTMAHRYT